MKGRLLLPLICALLPPAGLHAASDLEFFENEVRPLLVRRCYECHSQEKKVKGGLALDTRAGWERGGDSGPALVPGKPEDSLLMTAVSFVEKDLQMPPKQPLSAAEVAVLRKWVAMGAPDPRAGPGSPAAIKTEDAGGDPQWQEAFQKRLDWWSLRPLAHSSPPVVRGAQAAWPRDGIDRFILADLRKAGLSPAETAPPEVLLRRLALVLTGLPPGPGLHAQFMNRWAQDADRAYAWLVDTLLASPHFGERFARHWMDVVRYADTYGYEWDIPAKGASEYRDYLIRAFNADVGFDQMIVEQLAGDLMHQKRINRAAGVNEGLAATMFYHLGEHRHGSSLQFNGIHQDMVNNKIDAFSKAFLATTVACARCHDHKLEAVSQKDYYALAAVFMTPRWTARVVDEPRRQETQIARLKDLRAAIQAELAALWGGCLEDPAFVSLERLKQVLSARKPGEAKPPAHDVLHPLVRLHERGADAPAAWKELVEEWKAAQKSDAESAARFKPLGDFATGRLPPGWVMEGDGMKHGWVAEGAPLVALEGTAAVSALLEQGFHTHALSSKLPGAVRPPPGHALQGGFISLKAGGADCAGTLIVEGNAFLNETLGFFKETTPLWRAFGDVALRNGVHEARVELATAALNPNFPPRPGLLPRGVRYQDTGHDKRSWFSLTGIVSHDQPGAPPEDLDLFAPLYEGAEPADSAQAWERVGFWLKAAVRRWTAGTARPGDQRILNWMLSAGLLPRQMNQSAKLAALTQAYRAVEAGLEHPRTVNSMDERGVAKTAYPLNVRGNVDMPGPLVKGDFLQMFAGRNQVAASRGSGRWELARSLTDPDHPLTTRVYVNRVWQWIFGTGIVATPDDFGRLGGRPSHPDLLDYLAREFTGAGWQTKQLVRRLVLSQAFRQAGRVSPAARERDPGNRLLHHYPTRRLEAEAVRDSLLAVAGRLDTALYGRCILPPRTVEDGNKRLFSGPLDGNGRRSIYLQMSMMDPPKFLTGFNLPDMKLPTGRRDVTNVPGQALMLLNDPLVTAMARHWAGRLVQQPDASPEARLRSMFVSAFGRAPSAGETDRWRTALADFAAAPGADVMKDATAWEALAHALFNTKEFIYYR